MIRIHAIKNLNIRSGSPSVNAPCTGYYPVGADIVAAEVVEGDSVDGNNKWIKTDKGEFCSSAGTSLAVFFDSLYTIPDADPGRTIINYNKIVQNIPWQWRISRGEGINVLILDTGMTAEHSDFERTRISLFDSSGSVSGSEDLKGHGTRVAGLIGGSSVRTAGIIGVAPACRIVSHKIRHDREGIGGDYVKKALEWALTQPQPFDIINMSFNLNEDEYLIVRPLLSKLKEKGTLLVGAAGDNSYIENGDILFPAADDSVIAVGSINTIYPALPKFHKQLDFLFADHTYVTSSISKDLFYAKDNGCSFSSALVTGILALYLASGDNKKNQSEPARIKSDLAAMAFPYTQLKSLTELKLIKLQ